MTPSNHLSLVRASAGDYRWEGVRRTPWHLASCGICPGLVIRAFTAILEAFRSRLAFSIGCPTQETRTQALTSASLFFFVFNLFAWLLSFSRFGLFGPKFRSPSPILVVYESNYYPLNVVCRFANYVSGGSRSPRFFHRTADLWQLSTIIFNFLVSRTFALPLNVLD